MVRTAAADLLPERLASYRKPDTDEGLERELTDYLERRKEGVSESLSQRVN